jgi:uncharacterized membrane protein
MTEKTKKTFGLDKNVACALTYILGWVSGLVFFFSEKNDKEIRFHALQSIIFFGGINLIQMGFRFLWFPLSLISFIVWLICLVKSFQGEKIILPVVGEIAQKQVNKK